MNIRQLLYLHFRFSTKYKVFWLVITCSLERVRRFGRTCLHLQSRRVSQARKTTEAGEKKGSACRLLLLVSLMAYFSILKMEEIYPPKRRVLSEIHVIITSKTVLFICQLHQKLLGGTADHIHGPINTVTCLL
jgi:hypothetical protein